MYTEALVMVYDPGVQRRSLLQLGFLAPLMAWLDRIVPKRKSRVSVDGSFSGADEYVTVGEVLDFEPSQPFSVSFWAKVKKPRGIEIVARSVKVRVGYTAKAADDKWHHFTISR